MQLISQKNMSSHYQTYKGKRTKYQQKKNNQFKASFIVLVISAGILNAVFHPAQKIAEIIETKEIARENPNIIIEKVKTDDIKVIKTKLISKNPDIELQIRAIADEVNFRWPDYLVNLAMCESQLRPDAVNIYGNNPATSKDRGLFQFNSYHQARVSDECAFDIRCSTLKTIEMINRGDQHLWACNKIVLSKK